MMSPRGWVVLALLLPAACFTKTTAEDPLAGHLQDAGVLGVADSESGELRVTASVLLKASPQAILPWFREPELLVRWLAEEAETAPGEDRDWRLSWPSYGEEMRGRTLGGDFLDQIQIAVRPFASVGATTLCFSARPEAPGYTRVRLDQWPFPGGSEGEKIAEAHRLAWFRALGVLRIAMERELPTTPAPPPLVR